MTNRAIKEADFEDHLLTFPQQGSEWKIANISGAPGNSLGIQLAGPKVGLWYDHTTGYGGNFVNRLMANHNRSFLEAVSEIERCLGISFRTRDVRSIGKPDRFTCARSGEKHSSPRSSFQLSRQDLGRMATAAHRLASCPALIAQFVEARPEWTRDAIRQTALDGDLDFEGGKMLFGYRYAIKGRNGERVIRWLCRNAGGECWRQSLLTRVN